MDVHLTIVFHLLQDEVDSQNPVLRDNHQLHEEVKCWLKDQKVQEIFMQGESVLASSCQCCCGPFIDFADTCQGLFPIADAAEILAVHAAREALFYSAPQSSVRNLASAS